MSVNLAEIKQAEEDKKSKADLKVHNKILLSEVKALQDKVDYYEQAKSIKVQPIKSVLKSGQGEATAISLFSDFHCEQRIDKITTNGINKYNPDIAKQRAENYFINLLKRVEKHRRDVTIDNLVIGMLGDNIHGYIHEEYISSNYMYPIDATLFAQEQLERGLTYLLDHGKFKRIIVVCKVGNHSRTTLKCHTDNEALRSYEYMLYKQLEKTFNGQIEFLIENNYISYLQIYDKVNAFSHGHAIKYGGGIGGLYVPLVKYMTKQYAVTRFDMHFIGHFHTRTNIKKCIVNGCINGYDGYATKLALEPELPAQQFQLLDKEHGYTTYEPIFL